MSHAYDSRFMSYADRSSRASARRVAGLILAELPVASVLDIGCAKGTWLNVWSELGVGEIQGVDGEYVERDQLVIPPERFHAWNLAQPLDLARQFDLVQSLEVAEHIGAEHAGIFVENLVRHSRGIVLFSAAPPGQGGEFHVNEQHCDYWREQFALHVSLHATCASTSHIDCRPRCATGWRASRRISSPAGAGNRARRR